MRKTSFYFSFLALPAPRRRAIEAVFDFCRAVDDAVDLEADAGKAAEAADLWRAEVARVFDGGSPETQAGRALQPFVGPFNLPRDQFDALIDGVAMDAAPRRFETFADLEPYCHRVASSVGLICAEIFEYREKGVLDYARDLGVALQLTNILRDVGEDAARGRVYLPESDLSRFGLTVSDIRRGVHDERFIALMRFEIGRARALFDAALPGIALLAPTARPAVGAASLLYRAILDQIEAIDYQVHTQRARTSGGRPSGRPDPSSSAVSRPRATTRRSVR